MNVRISVVGGLLLAVVATGCASGGGGTPRNDTPVTGAQVEEYTSIMLALRELRPSWVRRAREVFVDGNFQGPVGILDGRFTDRIQQDRARAEP